MTLFETCLYVHVVRVWLIPDGAVMHCIVFLKYVMGWTMLDNVITSVLFKDVHYWSHKTLSKFEEKLSLWQPYLQWVVNLYNTLHSESIFSQRSSLNTYT